MKNVHKWTWQKKKKKKGSCVCQKLGAQFLKMAVLILKSSLLFLYEIATAKGFHVLSNLKSVFSNNFEPQEY